jgi:hypothetical protein
MTKDGIVLKERWQNRLCFVIVAIRAAEHLLSVDEHKQTDIICDMM